MMKMELHSPHSIVLATVVLSQMVLLVASPAAEQATTAKLTEPLVLDGSYYSALLMDADTGEVLVAKNPRGRRQPASMLKMMTELIILERIAEGDLAMDDEVTVSARASRMGGSQVYLKHGEVFTVEELLSALAIHSANDAALAMAEHVAGSREAFVDLMNLRAQELGMNDTVFYSVHGLPPGWKQEPDLTSVYDMAQLARELLKFPEAIAWASTSTAPFRDGKFIMYNPNKLVGKFRGLDGLKTGYHGQAGFCVAATAVQKEKRLISVVMGCPSDDARATETTRLLSYGFNLYTRVTLVEKEGQILGAKLPVRDGKMQDVEVAYAAPLTVSVPKSRVGELILEARMPDKAPAPLEAGQVVGTGVALLDGHVLGEVPIVTREAVPRGNWLDRILH